MKNFLLGLIVISFSSFAQTRYELLEESKLNWRGEDILRNGHDGTIQFQSGYVLVSEKKITKGDFIIDKNTLFSLDENTGKDIDGLSDHLKSDDFFSVETFPKAFFTIFSVSPLSTKHQYEIKGFLTIKGIINQIIFPANITTTETQVLVNTEFTFDRTLWNITYQSKNFLENIKDTAIADAIKVKLNLVLFKAE
jgi:polyisoprenoid-binding protein YceI